MAIGGIGSAIAGGLHLGKETTGTGVEKAEAQKAQNQDAQATAQNPVSKLINGKVSEGAKNMKAFNDLMTQ